MVVHIARLERDNLLHEYKIDTQRLMPWPVLNAPFEASYACCRAGTVSKLHAHHEQEIFVALSGEVEVECGGERKVFRAGDVCYFTPGQLHRVHNTSDQDFEFFSIWWDTAMTHAFLENHSGSETEKLSQEAAAKSDELSQRADEIEATEQQVGAGA